VLEEEALGEPGSKDETKTPPCSARELFRITLADDLGRSNEIASILRLGKSPVFDFSRDTAAPEFR
jgi:hypothetical protein